jgi:hypothetical protein
MDDTSSLSHLERWAYKSTQGFVNTQKDTQAELEAVVASMQGGFLVDTPFVSCCFSGLEVTSSFHHSGCSPTSGLRQGTLAELVE